MVGGAGTIGRRLVRPVPVDELVDHCLHYTEGNSTGHIVRAYG